MERLCLNEIRIMFLVDLGNFEPNDIPKKDGPGEYGKLV